MKRPFADLTGTRFGRLVPFESTRLTLSTGRSVLAWKCRCDCGNEVTVGASSLRGQNTTSCGCYARENAGAGRRTHDQSTTRAYRVHRAMLNRCYRERDHHFERYGGRGIAVCDRWRFGEDGKSGFECWRDDMGPKPTPKHSIDRVDNDGNYEPGNCRWATLREQAANTSVAGRSGHIGVSPNRQRGGWRAYIKVNKTQHMLGTFARFEDAVAARVAAEMRTFGCAEVRKGSAA